MKVWFFYPPMCFSLTKGVLTSLVGMLKKNTLKTLGYATSVPLWKIMQKKVEKR